MKKILLSILMLLAFSLTLQAATKANIYVTAQLSGLPMSLTATDVQMTGRTGGTAKNLTSEFGVITVLTQGKLATCAETIKVDFDPANNLYSIQTYLSNSGENYNVTKFMGNKEANYWDLGSEANGLIGTNSHDYVAAMLWSCRDDNTFIACRTNLIGIDWSYYKDKYTHVGEGATGIFLATNVIAGLAGKPNGATIASTGSRPIETWTMTWKTTNAYVESNPAHWVQGVDAIGYRKILFGTGGQYYHIATPSYDEVTPLTDKTVYLGIAANFDAKPAQYYRTRKMFVEIVAD